MTLLDIVTNASADQDLTDSPVKYPIILNPERILQNLKPQHEHANLVSLVCPISGWQLSQIDSQLIDLVCKFFNDLKEKLKDVKNFGRIEFFETLEPFLEKILKIVGISLGVSRNHRMYTLLLIENAGPLMGKDVTALVLEACVALKTWELVECMIVNRIVDQSCYSKLILNLVLNRRSDLICLCIKHAPVLQLAELICVLKYFLYPPKDALDRMVVVRKEWECQGLLAIGKASDENLTEKEREVAGEAAVLLMIAHDGFSAYELCMHYLLASSNVDDTTLSSAIDKLNGEEMARLINYLGKWLRKYETFPQACPCPKASSTLGLTACDWVPKLEDVVRYLGLVLDTSFSSLVLHQEFHEELRSIAEVASFLAAEARLYFALDNILEKQMVVSQSRKC